MKRTYFNMIEVTLALLVISIGVVSIFGLVPIGYKAHRDAIAHNYSTDAAEDLMNYLSDALQKDWDTQKAEIPNQPYDISNATNFPYDINGGNWQLVSNDHGWTSLPNWYENSVCSASGGDPNHSVFRVVVTSKVRHTGGQYRDVTDFDGVVRVWKTATEGFTYNTATSSWSGPQEDSAWEQRMLLHVEISWPATNPYGARSKAHFVREVLRRQ